MSEREAALDYEMRRRARTCEHLPTPVEWPGNCGIGVPSFRKAVEGNGGSPMGIALRMPCDGVADPIFRCPWYSPMGLAAAERTMIEDREAGRRTLRRVRNLIEVRRDAE